MQSQTQWNAVPPTLLTADGTAIGVVTVTDSEGFYVKQTVSLNNNTLTPRGLVILYFISDNQFVVGDQNTRLPVDISFYTTASASTISAPAQSRTTAIGIKNPDQFRAVFQEEPVVAIRTVEVDDRGNPTNGAKLNSTVPVKYDALQVLTTDGNDNPLTIGYYVGGLTGEQVWLSTFTYDSSGNLATYVGIP